MCYSFICISTWDAGRCTVNSINSVPQSTWCNDPLWRLLTVAAGAASLTHLQIFSFTVWLSSYFRTQSHSQCIKGKMCCISLLLSAPLAPPTFASISLDSLSSSSMFSPVRHENVGKVAVFFFFFLGGGSFSQYVPLGTTVLVLFNQRESWQNCVAARTAAADGNFDFGPQIQKKVHHGNDLCLTGMWWEMTFLNGCTMTPFWTRKKVDYWCDNNLNDGRIKWSFWSVQATPGQLCRFSHFPGSSFFSTSGWVIPIPLSQR